eukprot:Nk52_evm76s1810 gene=Nk52_evmTU76s1810
MDGVLTSASKEEFRAHEPRAKLKRDNSSLPSGGEDGHWMDDERKKIMAYEYLCHLQEAKEWMEACVKEELPKPSELEEELRNGVDLAKLGMIIIPDAIKKKKIFDYDRTRYNENGLSFRHTDNINQWFKFMETVGLPSIFFPTVTDLYDKKNMPKVIYCIHALSHFLFKKGLGPKMSDLVGKVEFTEDEIDAINRELQKHGAQMPAFSKVGGVLAKELNEEDAELHAVIIAINQAVAENDAHKLQTSVVLPCAQLTNIQLGNINEYLETLSAKQSRKSKNDLSQSSEELYDSLLDREEIQQALDQANENVAILAVNERVAENNAIISFQALQNRDAGLRFVQNDNYRFYQNRLRKAQVNKARELSSSSSSLNDDEQSVALHGSKVPMKSRMSSLRDEDLESGYGSSLNSLDADIDQQQKELCFLSKMEIQRHIASVNQEISALKLNACLRLQTLVRGIRARRFANDLKKERDQNHRAMALKNLSFFFRGALARRRYLSRLSMLRSSTAQAVTIQSWFRGVKQRQAFKNRLNFLNDQEEPAKKIQNWWRQKSATKHYRELTGKTCPPVGAVCSFLHLLDQSNVDYAEELALQRLRQKVVLNIRQNQKLAKQLNIMDIKIGLLVRNRISLDEVVAQSRKYKKKSIPAGEKHEAGLKALTKDKRDRLESYQHLFYLLQTEPDYLAKLVYLQPPSKTSRFMESVVLTVFNYAQNSREEYLLLKLFESAIREEMTNVNEIKDFTSGNPTVIKMVVHYNRGAKERLFLRKLLRPLMLKVLDQVDLHLNTNPVDIYKSWINNTEAETGKASGLPYEVSPEEALKHEHVKAIFNQRIEALKVHTDQFLDVINSASSSFPYGMRYIAMKLKEMLKQKFCSSDEDIILKVVGNLVYYRYVNPAIIAPDAFDVVESSTDALISSHERRNLGEISKMLQHISSNMRFGEDESYLSVLNEYISERFEKMKVFFKDVSSVSSAEEHFGIDQYSEVRTLSRPIIYISPKEIYSTHSLLCEHIDQLSPTKDSKLREILDDLGPAPNVENFTSNDNIAECEDLSKEALCSNEGEISLALQNKFEVSPDDDHDTTVLFLRTKRLLINIIRFQPGKTLTEIFATPCTDEQNQNHIANVLKNNFLKDEHDSKLTKQERHTSSYRPASDAVQCQHLQEVKDKALSNLKLLEEAKLVTKKSGYQEILNSLAQDIRNQAAYRRERKAEIQKLTTAVESLDEKTKYYEQQDNDYQEYIKSCIENMTTVPKPKKKISLTNLFSGSKKKSEKHHFGSFKYGAQKLLDKGVLVELEGVSRLERKGVTIEISSNEIGVFKFKGTFLGVPHESTEIHFDELLQMQYDGISIMTMFDFCKININLLIHLLNKKFYAK